MDTCSTEIDHNLHFVRIHLIILWQLAQTVVKYLLVLLEAGRKFVALITIYAIKAGN